MKPLCHKLSRAFTLLEIMVAIALLGLVVLAMYSSWNSILKGSKVALDATARAQRSRITMRALQDSLLCACMFNANQTNYYFTGMMEEDNSTLSFVAHLPKNFLRHGKYGDLNIRRVQFTVESGPENTKQLVMRQRPLIMDFDKNELDNPLVLATDVAQFKVEFLDPTNGDRITEWKLTNQLPREIFITLGLSRRDSFSSAPQETLFAVVAPPAHAVQREWQVPMNSQVGANPNGTAPVGGKPGTPGAPGGNPTPLKLQ